jgi:hypothetical protein
MKMVTMDYANMYIHANDDRNNKNTVTVKLSKQQLSKLTFFFARIELVRGT